MLHMSVILNNVDLQTTVKLVYIIDLMLHKTRATGYLVVLVHYDGNYLKVAKFSSILNLVSSAFSIFSLNLLHIKPAWLIDCIN